MNSKLQRTVNKTNERNARVNCQVSFIVSRSNLLSYLEILFKHLCIFIFIMIPYLSAKSTNTYQSLLLTFKNLCRCVIRSYTLLVRQYLLIVTNMYKGKAILVRIFYVVIYLVVLFDFKSGLDCMRYIDSC